jgi:hypothetical protein
MTAGGMAFVHECALFLFLLYLALDSSSHLLKAPAQNGIIKMRRKAQRAKQTQHETYHKGVGSE